MPSGARPNPPAHTLHALVTGDVDGAYRWANSLWVRNGNATSPDTSDLQDLAADIWGAYVSTFMDHLSGFTHLTGVDLIYYGSAGGEDGFNYEAEATGQSTNTTAPMNVACCISWKVQQRYKGGHPRTYLAGIPADVIEDPTTFTSAFVDNIAEDANAFLSLVNAMSRGNLDDLHLGVVSFVLDNDWRTPPVFRDYVPELAAVDSRIDSMRRRLGPDR